MKKRIIVIGNEKGGSGKTTISMHIISYLLYVHGKIASIDIDSRQKSLTRFIENRTLFHQKKDKNIPLSTHYILEEQNKDRPDQLEILINKAFESHDIIVVDTPGFFSETNSYIHSLADVVITPINDSFIDIELIARINGDNINEITPGIYSQMMWTNKLKKAKTSNVATEWMVVRNRLSNIKAKNKTNVLNALNHLSKKLGFTIAKGFAERVIFKELFIYGLTLSDILNKGSPVKLTPSHISARQELRNFIREIQTLEYEK